MILIIKLFYRMKINLQESLRSERGSVELGTVVQVVSVLLAGALLYTYGIETINQVVNCKFHDKLLPLHTFTEQYVPIQPYLTKYLLSFFEGAFGTLRLTALHVAVCLK